MMKYQNVYFINGNAYAGKSTIVKKLAEKYNIQFGYFKKTFYKDAEGREQTARYLQASAAQLENLLRYPGVKNILCNRYNNLNYDQALKHLVYSSYY